MPEINADRKYRLLALIAPEEIAVLFRANFQSRALEEAFLKAEISVGGKIPKKASLGPDNPGSDQKKEKTAQEICRV